MPDLYSDEEFRQWVHLAWSAHAHWPRRRPPKMDDLRLMLAHALDRMAPKIAARAADDELRALVAYCFDEHDALVAEGGIDTVEAYIARRRAELEAGR